MRSSALQNPSKWRRASRAAHSKISTTLPPFGWLVLTKPALPRILAYEYATRSKRSIVLTVTRKPPAEYSTGTIYPVLSTLELCAGAGGQALGLEQAGIGHAGLIEIDSHACATLRLNRPHWYVLEQDLTALTDASAFKGVDIVSGGLPCPPFSKAGKQLGHKDERNLFPAAIHIVDQLRPRAVMIENVRGILDAVFEDYRKHIAGKQIPQAWLRHRLAAARAHPDFGVPQLRPRVVFIAIQSQYANRFSAGRESLPEPRKHVGEVLYDLMAAKGWRGAKAWKKRANEIAPTVVGGSKKHGGPDLGPTRAKACLGRAWRERPSVGGRTSPPA